MTRFCGSVQLDDGEVMMGGEVKHWRCGISFHVPGCKQFQHNKIGFGYPDQLVYLKQKKVSSHWQLSRDESECLLIGKHKLQEKQIQSKHSKILSNTWPNLKINKLRIALTVICQQKHKESISA